MGFSIKQLNTKISKKKLAVILSVEFILVLLATTVFFRVISLNSHDKIVYSEKKAQDSVSCADGKLIVNDVTAKVPTGSNASYDISYSWAEDDTDYPSIPRAAIVSYHDKDGDLTYELSLYRNSFTPNKEIPDGKDASTWFDDWGKEEDKKSGLIKKPLKTEKVSGFLISPFEGDDEKRLSLPASSTFYFAVKNKTGISVYCLEGILYNKDYEKKLREVMDKSISSIRVGGKAA